MPNEKASERTLLVFQLGRLLAALQLLTEQKTPPTKSQYRLATAQFNSDLPRWRDAAFQFATFGTVQFSHELDEMLRELSNLVATLAGLARDSQSPAAKQAYLRDQIQVCRDRVVNGINAVPLDWSACLFPQGTPFSTCMSIRDAVLTAQSRVHYFDRYVSADFFSLYLRDLPRALQIRLATTHGNNNYGVKNVLPFANLAAAEFFDFQLIECHQSTLHDRNLRIDDRVFNLGSSMNGAGKYPTNFTPADSSAAAHNILDTILSAGTKVV